MTPRVGVDVAAIPRIAEAQKRFGDRFLRKFLTAREIDYCGGSAERWAGRWAAKEAIGKAMPSGVRRPSMRDVEILPSEDGRPHVRVAPATALTGRDIDVSIAHDGHFAVAVAVIPEAEAIQPDGELPDGFKLPARPRDGHKGTFGTVVVLAGSQGYTGAAYLTSMGAARSGAGIVRLMVAQSIYPILAEKCTEVVVGPIPEISPGVVGHAALSAVLRGFTGAASGIVGPGIGRDTSTRRLIEDLLPKVTVPLVLDADALNLLAEHRSILPKLSPSIVLTPHPAEFGRLANMETSAVQKDRRGIASRFAKTWNKVVVLKGAGTVIAAPDGRITLNPIATPALASGGTGDVLAGLIGGLMAQKLPPFEAAVTGVHIHSVAGTDLEASLGQAGVLASDLLPQIPRVMERLR
ncbi:MAG: ADP-dependent NAD(P)H-hydrate dehydratase / NAD(P)H-hydrate epimerase [Chloroflexota bacterium]|nr:ADP-dependent NAD(P)H-hydrate dehydratase / NAD(P)H-hydrate epimerase [Chloroflexota bacterium]